MVIHLWHYCFLSALFLLSVKCVHSPRQSLAFLAIAPLSQQEKGSCGYRNLKLSYDPQENVALYTVRGGQYFLPTEQLEQRRLQEEWSAVSQAFGFAEYSLGVLTYARLYGITGDSKQGEHRNEVYTFNDRKGRKLALRGDVTPQFMAMLRSHREGSTEGATKFTLSPAQASKWFTMADCWRYERPAHCRRRNHLQWTCDIVGIPEETAEIELLTMLIHFFLRYRLSSKDVGIQLNHHASTAAILQLLGRSTEDPQWMYEFRKVMDKYRKLPREKLVENFMKLGLGREEIEKLFGVISSCTTVSDLERTFSPEEEFVKPLRNIMRGLQSSGLEDWVTIDLSIVRGNDYYNGPLFECFDRLHPRHRAIAGGGRYDGYFADKESHDRQLSYAVGFGMGNVAIVELLRDRGIREKGSYADVVVFGPTPSDYKAQELSSLQNVNMIVSSLRSAGLKVYQYYKTSKWPKALEFAERVGATSFVHPQLYGADLSYQVYDLGHKTKVSVLGVDQHKVVELVLQAKGKLPSA